jgi:hypothetical protein
MKIENIYDSFVDIEEKEIFLCRVAGFNELIWIQKSDIPKTTLVQYTKKAIVVDEYRDKEESIKEKNKFCNVDKTDSYTCDIKCRTRGIIIACTNCGVIIGSRELYGAESLSQVCQFFLDIKDKYASSDKIQF